MEVTVEMDSKIEPSQFMEMSLIEVSDREDSDCDSDSPDFKTILEKRIETLMQRQHNTSENEEDDTNFTNDSDQFYQETYQSPYTGGRKPGRSPIIMQGCPDCGLAFRGAAELHRHQLNEHGGLICPATKADNSSDELARPVSATPRVVRPLLSNAAANYLQCSVCLLLYKTALGLRQHMISVHGFTKEFLTELVQLQRPPSISVDSTTTGLNLVNCPFCPSKYLSAAGVHRHIKLMHAGKMGECTLSLKTTPPPPMQPASPSEQLQCQHCPMVLDNSTQMCYHLDQFHRRALYRSSLRCPKCSLNFIRQTSLTRHLEIHSYTAKSVKKTKKNSVLFIQCDLCPLRFMVNESRRHKRHVQSAHHSNKYDEELAARTPRINHICDLCNCSFASAAKLQRHRKIRHRNQDLPVKYFQCERCPLRFPVANLLRLHVEKKHQELEADGVAAAAAQEVLPEEVNYFQCEFCPLRFVSEAMFIKHLKKHRKGTIMCECGKRFIRHHRARHLLKCPKQREDNGGKTNPTSTVEKYKKGLTSTIDMDKEPLLESVCPLECEVAITVSDDTAQVEASLALVVAGAADRSFSSPRSFGRPRNTLQRGCSECGLAFPPTGNELRIHLYNEHGIGVPMRSQRVIKMEKAAIAAVEKIINPSAKDNDDDSDDDDNGNESRSSTPDALVCNHCSNRYVGKSRLIYLRKHITKKHPEHMDAFILEHPSPPKPPSLEAPCPLCPSVFKSNAEVRGHLKANHCTIRTRSFLCEYCGAAFRRSSQRRLHAAKCNKNTKNARFKNIKEQSHDEDLPPAKVAKLEIDTVDASAKPLSIKSGTHSPPSAVADTENVHHDQENNSESVVVGWATEADAGELGAED